MYIKKVKRFLPKHLLQLIDRTISVINRFLNFNFKVLVSMNSSIFSIVNTSVI